MLRSLSLLAGEVVGVQKDSLQKTFDHLGLGGLRVAGKIIINSNENMLGTYYVRLHGMKHHTQSQSKFTFCLIKLYQRFSETIVYLWDIHNTLSNHIFTCLYICSHISQSCGQQ